MNDQLKFFSVNSYVLVHNALTPAEVSATNEGIDADRAAHPEHWDPGPRPGHIAVGCDAPELLHRTTALDGVAFHPSIVPLVRRLLGPGAQMSGLTFLRRDPCSTKPPVDIPVGDPLCLERVWHREDGGNVEGAEMNDYFVPALQVIFYLDDVDAGSHCFSVIPESVETKRKLPKKSTGGTGWGELGQLRIDDRENGYVDPDRSKWVDAFGRELPRRMGGVDLHARAGSAVVFNNSSYHCGTIRHTQRQRRTVHVRYRQPEPLASRHALKPPWESVAHFTKALPSRLAIGSL